MRKVVSLAVLLAVISMLFLNAAAEIGIIESPNIDIIQMEMNSWMKRGFINTWKPVLKIRTKS